MSPRKSLALIVLLAVLSWTALLGFVAFVGWLL